MLILTVNIHILWGRDDGNLKNEIDWISDSIQTIKKLALESYYSAGDYTSSIELFKQLGVLYFEKDRRIGLEHSNIYSNISLAFSQMWEYDSAIYYLHLAEKIYSDELLTENENLGNLYSRYGSVYVKKGDYVQARQFYEKARAFLENAMEEPFIGYERILYNRMGLLEMAEGKFHSAKEYFNMSLELVEKYDMGTQAHITSYLNLALPYAELNQFEKSIELELKAIELCRIDSANNLYYLGKLYNNISLDFLELKQFIAAENYMNKGLGIALSGARNTDYLSDIYDSYGTLYRSQGNYNKALDYYQKGIITISKEFKDKNPLVNPVPDQIFNTFRMLQLLKSKTTCLYEVFTTNNKFNYLEAAINTANLSIRLIDDLRNSYLSRESKLQLAKQEGETYMEALEFCRLAFELTRDHKYIHQAFIIAEKNKSSVLLSSLRETEAKEFGGIPEELLYKERILSKRIAFYKENLYEENQNADPDSVKMDTWESYLFQVQREHDDLIQLFEKRYPEYYSLKYNTSVVKVNTLQKNLKNTSIIEYALTDSSLFTFIIERNKFRMHKQKIDSGFYTLIHAYLSLFQDFDFSRQSYNSFIDYCRKSKALYNILIEPVADMVSNGHVMIVPDGILSYLPFETLIRQVPDKVPADYYRSLNYLMYSYAISYSYSSTLFHQAYSGTETKKRKKLAAFAPTYTTGSISDFKSGNQLVTRQKYRKNLYPIPGVKEEIEEISKIVSSDVYSGDEASETVFRRVAGKYDLLHLAMHTVVDNENPMFSKLIFSNTPDSVNDGLLNTYEIFGLRLKARLVVLSACSTGEGDYSDGEGVISLARGFVYAGSPSLVMTMWEVEDKSSITIMKSFYQNLFAGKTKSEALRDAKIAFIRSAKPENTHPFFWSTFVILGNTKAIAWKTKSLILVITISLIITTTLILTAFKLYKRYMVNKN